MREAIQINTYSQYQIISVIDHNINIGRSFTDRYVVSLEDALTYNEK